MPFQQRKSTGGGMNVPKALAAINAAQMAQGNGDAQGFEMAVRELKLMAKEKSIAQQRSHDKEIKGLQDKLVKTQNDLQKKMTENVLKGKIQEALDTGDMPLFDKLMSILTESQRPASIQAYDQYKTDRETGALDNIDDRTDARDLLGGAPQSALERLRSARDQGLIDENTAKKGASQMFVEPETPVEQTDEEKNVNLLQTLLEGKVISKEQFDRGIAHITNSAQEDGRTNNQKDVEAVEELVKRGVITEAEGKELIMDIYGDPSSSKDSDDNGTSPSALIQARAVNDPVRRSANNLSVDMTKDARENIDLRVQNIVGNSTWEELDANSRSAVADIYANAVETSKQAGGEIAGREAVAMQTMRRELPSVKEHLNILNDNGITIGKGLQIKEGILRLTGETIDPLVGAAVTQINNLTNAFIALRSGAQVSESEFARYQSMLANIGKNNEFNQAIVDEMIRISDRAVRFYYDKKLDSQIVQVILDDTSPTWWDESNVQKLMKESEISRDEAIKLLRESK